MDPKKIARQIIAFNKSCFDNNFNAMSTFQEQTARFVNKLLEKVPMFPEEGKKAYTEWLKNYKKGCDEFKNKMDENFKKMEDFYNEIK
ncbi:MAG: hypothetical protein HGB33_09485 [Syntrophaceae bacterium]|nr:hypothetical protein [Syntrophaceae bacterium]